MTVIYFTIKGEGGTDVIRALPWYGKLPFKPTDSVWIVPGTINLEDC